MTEQDSDWPKMIDQLIEFQAAKSKSDKEEQFRQARHGWPTIKITTSTTRLHDNKNYDKELQEESRTETKCTTDTKYEMHDRHKVRTARPHGCNDQYVEPASSFSQMRQATNSVARSWERAKTLRKIRNECNLRNTTGNSNTSQSGLSRKLE